MDRHWTFRSFKDAGVNIADAWLGSLPANYEENFRTLINHMAITKTWKGDYFKALTGYRNLYEIKLSKSVQYRLLCCYGKTRGEFIFLIGASKVSDSGRTVWNPRNALAVAIERRELFFSSEVCRGEYE
jgi:hypothetical protein